MSTQRFAGKVMVVTGAAQGIGRAVALRAAAEGGKVLFVDRAEFVSEVAAEAGGAETAGFVADLETYEGAASAMAFAVRKFGGIDILINDAFRAEAPGSFEKADMAEWRAVADVNLWGTLTMIKAALPALKASGTGAIVNINTHGSEALDPDFGGYTSSKAALQHLTRHLAREFGPYGIRVNGVHPGPMDALPRRNFLDARAAALGTTADALDAPARERTSLGHLASAEDVARAVTFLASPLARSITGQALFVDGGAWLH